MGRVSGYINVTDFVTTASAYPPLAVKNMVIQLYGHPEFGSTRLVLMILLETKTPYELHVLDYAAGALKREEYLEKQPFGQLPYIVR
jgi:hypothetical protein